MAPEVASLHRGAAAVVENSAEERRGEEGRPLGYGFPVDWWGLGVLFFECLTAKAPFGYRDYQVDNAARVSDLARRSPATLSLPPDLELPADAVDFLRCLLQADPCARLGGRGGAAEVKLHPFFRDIDWNLLTLPPSKLSPAQLGQLRSSIPPFNAAFRVDGFASPSEEECAQESEDPFDDF